jgi:hypothetical protein
LALKISTSYNYPKENVWNELRIYIKEYVFEEFHIGSYEISLNLTEKFESENISHARHREKR